MKKKSRLIPWKHLSGFVIAALVIALASCGSRHTKRGAAGIVDETFADALNGVLPAPDTAQKHWSASNDMHLVYEQEDYQPVWLNEAYRPNEAARKMLDSLADCYWDGYDTTELNLPELRLLTVRLDTTRKNSLTDALKFDTSLTTAFLKVSRFLLMGSISPKSVDSLWYHKNDTDWQAPNMLAQANGHYPMPSAMRSEWPTYALLRSEYRKLKELEGDSSYLNAKYNVREREQVDSVLETSAYYIILSELPWLELTKEDTMSDEERWVRGYQHYKSLRETGRLDSATRAVLGRKTEDDVLMVEANMERIRWMPRVLPATPYVVVDVPLMELYLRKDGANVLHKRVVVGKPARQTPSLGANMTNVVINPPWGVPPTILKKDVLPGIQKSGKEYLAKKGLRIYDKDGKPVNVGKVNARNYRNFTYKQAPGDDNSLGYVKFNMPNKWDIYLHDTPHRDDFGKRDRALSSGCVRVHNPQEMALYILGVLEDKTKYTQGRLDTIISTHKTRWENLKNKIPVFVTYLTVFEDSTGGHIRFAKDVYGRDEKLKAKILSLNGHYESLSYK